MFGISGASGKCYTLIVVQINYNYQERCYREVLLLVLQHKKRPNENTSRTEGSTSIAVP